MRGEKVTDETEERDGYQRAVKAVESCRRACLHLNAIQMLIPVECEAAQKAVEMLEGVLGNVQVRLEPQHQLMCSSLAGNFTILIPWVPAKRRTEWHPTEKIGPWHVLSRGAFGTEEEAHEWARANLNGSPYKVKKID